MTTPLLTSRAFLVALIITVSGSAPGCSTCATSDSATDISLATREQTPPLPPGAMDDTASGPTERAAAPGTPSPLSSDPEKITLEAAYLEIYCVQKLGETEKLLDVYKRHGFEDPGKWVAMWKKHSREDTEWVIALTERALKTCP